MDSLPQPLPTGTETYYLERRHDFLRRQPLEEPPTYYAEYGDKCLHQFVAVEPDMTPDGKTWLRRTLRLLQDKMEDALAADPEHFARLELDDKRFEEFAFSTHSQAYLDAGLLELPVDDIWRIVRTPDLMDLLRPNALREIVDVLEETSLHDVAAILLRRLHPGG